MGIYNAIDPTGIIGIARYLNDLNKEHKLTEKALEAYHKYRMELYQKMSKDNSFVYESSTDYLKEVLSSYRKINTK